MTKRLRQPRLLKTIAVFAAIVFVWSAPNSVWSAPNSHRSAPNPQPSVPISVSAQSNSAFEQVKLPANVANPQNIKEFRLKSNGLNVILVERHATPIVTTMIVYHIGSRNEAVGYTGSTHFLEHMMFKGTKAHDPLNKTGFDDLLKPLGGYNNATTSQDRTNYFEITPAKSLPLTLEIEADRMQHLLLRSTDRASEMTVVRNELERGEDDPRQLLENNLFSTAFKEHPYHHPVIGWKSDVEGVPIERLKQFYKDFYWPNNATLILVGDFKTAPTLALIQKYFGHIARAPKPYPKVYTSESPQEGERRFTVRRGSESPKLMLGYHSPNALDKDQYALAIIENLLGDESKRSSRLYKKLIDRSLASDVNTWNYMMRDPGLFTVTAAAAPNVPLDKVEKETVSEINRFKTEPVPIDELNRAKQSIVKKLKLDASDPVGLADQLTEIVAAADLKWWLTYAPKIQAVTQADIMRVAKKYFGDDNRTVGFYLPKVPGETEVVAETPPAVPPEDASTESPATSPQETSRARPASAIAADQASFAARTRKQVLPNGLTVLVLPIAGTGTVAVSGKIQAGSIFRDLNKTQVPEFVADLLTKGSSKYSKEALAQRLEEMGTSLSFGEDDFFTSFDTEAITEDFPSLIEMASDCIRKPKFIDSELAKTKKQKHSVLKDRISSTTDQSWNAFVRALYKPESCYYDKKFEDQIKELDGISTSDLRSFHEAHYIPANTVLSIVGDIDPDDAFGIVKKQFEGWTGGSRQELKVLQSDVLPSKSHNLMVPMADKANVDVIIGRPVAVSIRSKDYAATAIGNAAFGYDSFACRLGPVRDQYGLTYSISSYLAGPLEKFAPWAISFSINPENFDKTVSLVRTILADFVRAGITAKELNVEKSHLAGAFYVGMRSSKQIAVRLSEYEILGLGAKYIDNYARMMDAVTIDQVNESIRKYFNLDHLTITASGTFKPKEQRK